MAGCPAYAQLKQVLEWPNSLHIVIVNHHITLFLGAMLEASSAPACLSSLRPAHASHEQGTRHGSGFGFKRSAINFLDPMGQVLSICHLSKASPYSGSSSPMP